MRWPKPVILLLHFRRLFGAAFFVVIILQKAVFHPILLPTQKGIQIDHMNGTENVLFHVGIGLFQFPQQLLAGAGRLFVSGVLCLRRFHRGVAHPPTGFHASDNHALYNFGFADLEKVVAIPLTWGKLHGSTVLVTGATGAIGSQIVRTLLAANRLRQCQMHIIAMARSIEKAHQVFGDLLYRPSMEVLVADVTKVIHIDCAVDYIFHTAGVTASKEIVTDPVQTIEVSVIGTKNILDLAKEKQ